MAVPTEPMGSMSSMEVNVDMLEQMDLMDISDQEALDVFLNSGGEENTLLSPISGRGEKPADIIIITLSTVISLWLGFLSLDTHTHQIYVKYSRYDQRLCNIINDFS